MSSLISLKINVDVAKNHDVKTRCGYQFLGAIINSNTKDIEMKFEAFESQTAIVLEIVKN